MEKEENKYVAVAYELYTTDENGAAELVEKAPAEHPFQFITGMGFALDAFEERIAALAEGSEFDFVLPSTRPMATMRTRACSVWTARCSA